MSWLWGSFVPSLTQLWTRPGLQRRSIWPLQLCWLISFNFADFVTVWNPFPSALQAHPLPDWRVVVLEGNLGQYWEQHTGLTAATSSYLLETTLDLDWFMYLLNDWLSNHHQNQNIIQFHFATGKAKAFFTVFLINIISKEVVASWTLASISPRCISNRRWCQV